MLALLKEWRIVQAVGVFFSALGARLSRAGECLLTTGSEFNGNRLILLPVRLNGTRMRRSSRLGNGEERFPTRKQAGTILLGTRSSSRSRFPR